MPRALAALLTALLAACGTSGKASETNRKAPEPLGSARGAAIELTTSPTFEEIARLEDARSLGNGRLVGLLASDIDARVRARAATALGRFPFPWYGAEVTESLVRALEDPELGVRIAAAFALGVRGDPASAGTLLAYRNDPEARLRATVVEAASRLSDPTIQAQLALSLRDADLGVRLEAAIGAARWDTKASGANEIDRALLDALHPYRITREAAPKTAIEAELVWRILWALGRRKAELGRGPFLEYASSDVVLERLFALRGLGQLAPDAEGLRAAAAALSGPKGAKDWRVAYEAAATIGRFASAEEAKQEANLALLLDALEAATKHPSAHVRAAVMEALGNFPDNRRVLELLQRGRIDLSVSVRAATLRARVRMGDADDALEALRRGAKDDDPVLRGAAAEAAGELKDPRAGEVLLTLARDPSLFVSTRAVEQLGQHASDEVRAALHGFLANADNGLRLAAVLALKAMPAPADVGAVIQAATSAKGDGSSELAFNALQLLVAIGTGEGQTFVEHAQSDPRPYVRTVAKKLVRGLGFEPSTAEPPYTPDRKVPLPGADYPVYRFDPMVELTTTRGTMVFELFPAEAPVHVHNFLKLVETRQYDGLTFHRVVPDFVVQGGDYRGDGNGGRPYEGESMRAEFTPRKSTRGSLGMPRNEDPDSGGSQFFVTHLPTPHLDGRYTFFGELRAGGEVLDLLEVGDRILSARLLE